MEATSMSINRGKRLLEPRGMEEGSYRVGHRYLRREGSPVNRGAVGFRGGPARS